MATVKKKGKKPPPRCACRACEDGGCVPDTIQFGTALDFDTAEVIQLRCGYCRNPLVWKQLARLDGILLRSTVMAERANAST